MRFYTNQHAHSCGIDLHAKTMYLCILGKEGEVLLHKNMKATPTPFSGRWSPSAKTSSSPSSASSPGTGSLISAKQHDAQTFHRLRSIPGVGKILAMTILYEIHDIARFPRVQDFLSYARLVKGEHSSAGKRLGSGGAKIGNVHLKWAFSEAASLFLRMNPEGQKLQRRLAGKHGKGKAMSILAAKLGRAVYLMLSKDRVFEMEHFLAYSK